MNFKNAIETVKLDGGNFGRVVEANMFLLKLDYQTIYLGDINGILVIKYVYDGEIYYWYKNGFKTIAQLVALIDRLMKYSEKVVRISEDIFKEFNINVEDYIETGDFDDE